MSLTKSPSTHLIPPAEGPATASDEARRALLASLETARRDIAAGEFEVLTPGTLRREFDAILDNDMDDAPLDALHGITVPPSR